MYTKEMYHNYLRRHEEYHAWRNSTFYSTMAAALKMEEGPEKERLLDDLIQEDEDKRPGIDTARHNWLGGYDITYSPSAVSDGWWKPIKENTIKDRQRLLAEWKDEWEAK